MMFDPKKMSIIIGKSEDGMGESTHGDSSEKDSDYSDDGLVMAMKAFTKAIKMDEPELANKAMISWCKIYKNHECKKLKSEKKSSDEY